MDPTKILDKGTAANPTYSYTDILQLEIPQPSEMFIPLGMRFADSHDPFFPAYPYAIPQHANTLYDPNPKNPLLLFDDSLLLNYGPLKYNMIYICMTDDVFEFVHSRKISEQTAINTYYPLLAKTGTILSKQDVIETRTQRTQINRRILNPSIITLYDKIAMFHEIGRRTHGTQGPGPEYEYRGIEKMWITIHPEVKHTIPLDVLFRNIHATKTIPMIKYNPGLRYDNLFRFYYQDVSPNLTKIPFLTKSEIMKILEKIGSKKQLLTVVVMVEQHGSGVDVATAATDTPTIPVIIDIFPNGNISIRAEFVNTILLDKANLLVLQMYSTIRKIVNNILQESGYSLIPIQRIYHPNIEIIDIVYRISAISKKLDFQKYSGCISSVFNVLDIDYQKGIEMRYKRVENYTEMEAENAYILEIYKKTNNEMEILDALKSNLGLSEEEARIKIIQFLTEHQKIKGAYVNRAVDFIEHPGFHVIVQVEIISETEFRNTFIIQNINYLEYIHMLEIYIDSFIRINENIGKCGVSKTDIQRLCKTVSKKNMENERDERHTDVIVGVVDTADTNVAAAKNVIFQEDSLAETESKIIQDIYEPDVEDDEYEEAILFDDYGDDEEEDDDSKTSDTKTSDTKTSDTKTSDTKSSDTKTSDTKSSEKGSSTAKSLVGQDVKEALKSSIIAASSSSSASAPNKLSSNTPVSTSNQLVIHSNSESGSNSDNILFDDYEDYDASSKSAGGASERSSLSSSSRPSSYSPDATITNNNIDGLLLNESNNNYFLKRLKTREPTLFISKPQGKFKTYSRLCQSQFQRQPVILNKREYERLKNYDQENYTQALKYNDNYYICPRYWCLKTNSTITQADVDAGKCGNIIPKNADKVPIGAYVYEFNHADQHHSSIDTKIKTKVDGRTVDKVVIKKGEYFKNNPGFLSPDSSPDGKCLPCCFRKLWDSDFLKKQLDQCGIRDDPRIARPQISQQDTMVEAADMSAAAAAASPPPPVQDKKDKYISAIERFPLPERRFGFLPISIQFFFGFHYKDAISTTNSAELKKDKPVLLRYGTEQSNLFSFVSALCDIYATAHKDAPTTAPNKIPTVRQMRQILADAITLDDFTQLHNSTLPAIFKPPQNKYTEIDYNNPEYTNSRIYKSTNLQNPIQEDQLHNTIAAYQEYKHFLTDPTTTAKIDHEYLWDAVTTPNPRLFKRGLNLVILNLANNDLTDNIEMICPSSTYSNNLYDPRKETLILLKRDPDPDANYPIYEPIYLYEDRTSEPAAPHITRTFKSNTEVKNVERVITMIQSASKTKCRGLPSAPKKIIPFRTNHPIQQVISILKKYNLTMPVQQVINYQGKIIGVIALQKKTAKQTTYFLPTAPSTPIPQMPTIYMDDDDIWQSYQNTRDFLTEIRKVTKGEIYSQPLAKVVEDGMIVGILTETNQFVRVDPPEENTLFDDALETVDGEDTILADTFLTRRPTTRPNALPNNREFITKCIQLESKMYSAFRSFVRILLNSVENKEFREEIAGVLDAPPPPNTTYNEKLKKIIATLVRMTQNKIKFTLFDKPVIMAITDIFLSNTDDILYLSKEHLISKYISEINKTPMDPTTIQNKQIYFTRLADEFIRHPNIQQFMMSSQKYTNVSNTEYKINPDEFIVLNSMLTGNYFDEIEYTKRSKYIHNTVYDNARPQMIEQNYSDDVSIQEQQEYLRNRPEAGDKRSPTEASLDNPLFEECQEYPPGEIEGNKRSKWRIRFEHTYKDAKEWKFKNSINCTYAPIIYIMYDYKRETVTIQQIKTALIKQYQHYMTIATYKPKIFHILEKQGKSSFLKTLQKSKTGFDTAIASESYYLTDLDTWMLAEAFDLPIVLYSTRGIISMVSTESYREIDWMVLDRNFRKKERFYFVKSDTTKIKIPRPHIIIPCMTFEDLGSEMGKMMKHAETMPNFHSLTQFLENYDRES
jgi:hypothetical protein